MNFGHARVIRKHAREQLSATLSVAAARKRYAGGIEQAGIVGQLVGNRTKGRSAGSKVVRHVVAQAQHLANRVVSRGAAKMPIERTDSLLVKSGAERGHAPVAIHFGKLGIPPGGLLKLARPFAIAAGSSINYAEIVVGLAQ